MVSKEDLADEACNLYQQAANCYKLGKNWDKATECYMRCIDCSSEHDQAPFYLEAAHCQKKVSLKGFIELAEMAINQYCLKGSISSAASLAKEIAESLEEEYDYEESARFFEKTADLYHMEESVTQSHSAIIKASDLYIMSRNYTHLEKAIKNYDRVGRKYLTVPLIKSSAKDLFFKAIMCYMANDDMVGAKRAIQTYQIEDPSFDGSREEKLLSDFVSLIDEKNIDKFKERIQEHQRITPFDKLKLSLAVRIQDLHFPQDGFVGSSAPGVEPDFTGQQETNGAPGGLPDFT